MIARPGRTAGDPAIEVADGRLIVGAQTSYGDLLGSSDVATRAPLLHAMARQVVSASRSLAPVTVGGTVENHLSASDLPATLVALGANVVMRDDEDEWKVGARYVFVGDRRTAIAPGRTVSAVEISIGPIYGVGYCRLTRGSSSRPVAVGAANAEWRVDSGEVSVSVGIGACVERPHRVTLGPYPIPEAERKAEADIRRIVCTLPMRPYGDAVAGADYRMTMAPLAAGRAVATALGHWT